jgi:hypothetical protein
MDLMPPVSARVAALGGVVLTALFATSVPPVAAQVVEPDLWIPNGSVNAVVRHQNTIYIGGNFTAVGPATGAHAAFDPATGAVSADRSRVLGTVHTIVPDGAGGVYLGGLFTHVDGEPRSNLAHVDAGGNVTAWDPGTNGPVYALLLGTGGTVYVGGEFTQLRGLPRANLGEIDANGEPTTWIPGTDAPVRALEQSGNNVYVGGDFASAGSRLRFGIAAIPKTSNTATTWNPNCIGQVHCLKVINHFVFGQGFVTSLVVGGDFSQIGGLARNNAANLSLTTGAAQPWNPNTNGTVRDIADPGVELYIAGDFTTVGGQSRTYVAGVNDMTGAVNGWVPSVNGPVEALLLRNNNLEIVIGGRFTVVNGQTRRGLAALDLTTPPGPVTAWNPNPGDDVLALAQDATWIHAGGEFMSANLVPRFHLAALDASSGEAIAWGPGMGGPVHALELNLSGDGSLVSVYVGGSFTQAGTAERYNLAEIDVASGLATGWHPGVLLGPVFCLDKEGSLLYAGGSIFTVGGVPRNGIAAIDVVTGLPNSFAPAVNSTVLAVEATAEVVYIGGHFTSVNATQRRYIAALEPATGNLTPWNPDPGAAVRALSLVGSRLYVGGDFLDICGIPLPYLAAVGTAVPAALDNWAPFVSARVRSIVPGGSHVWVGGEFADVGGAPRAGVAGLDAVTADAAVWDGSCLGGSVNAVAVYGTEVIAAGSHTSAASLPHASLTLFRGDVPSPCSTGPLASSAGAMPRALVPGDFDGDGITDLVVCNATTPPVATVLRGQGVGGSGSGTFTPFAVLPLSAPGMHAATADFDVDGLDDIAVSQSDDTGIVTVFRNLGGGSFATGVEYPVFGRCDGIAAADADQDGITDLLVCLVDSADVALRGGVQLLKGGGSGGVWNGGFTPGLKTPTRFDSVARRVIVQDFNLDGVVDLAYCGTLPGKHSVIRMLPGFVPSCLENVLATQVAPSAIAAGDLNGDGRSDLAVVGNRSVQTKMRTTNDSTECSNPAWFLPGPILSLPSTPREIAFLDHDQDGFLDLVCTFDSLGTVVRHRGLGDGGFEAAGTTLASLEAWGLLVGDFATNGMPDLLIGQPSCGVVTVISEPGPPIQPVQLVLTSPNGGEIWSQAPAVVPASAVPSPVEEAVLVERELEALASPEDGPRLAFEQMVTWSKGAGVHGVDIQVTRTDGDTWQTIAHNQPGTSFVWLVTPPASSSARVRVRDALVATRADASDEVFRIVSGVTAVDPLAGLPRVAALELASGNPVRGTSVRFRLDVPAAGEARVDVYNVAGRLVQTVARGRFEPGRHDVSWAGARAAEAASGGPVPGVYFVRARVGSTECLRKFVVLP